MAGIPGVGSVGAAPDRVADGRISGGNFSPLGGTFAEGISHFGDQIFQAGSIINEKDALAAKRQKAQDDSTAANAAMNDFQQHVRTVQYGDPNDPQTPGFLQMQGKQAMDAWGSTQQGIDQYRKSLSSSLTPEQQQLFDRDSQSFQNSAFTAMASHVGQQRNAYQLDTANATIDNAMNAGAANYQNPAAFASGLTKSASTVRGYLAFRGVPPDSPIAQQLLQQNRDRYISMAAKTAQDNDDAIGAQSILESNRVGMSPEAYSIAAERNRPALYRQQGDMLGNSVINHTGVNPIPSGTDPSATFGAMVHLESGGRQTDGQGNALTSSKGAVGQAQLMPDTAKEVARSVGLDWDESRFRQDGAYNRALGEAYFQQLCQRYNGNQTLATAAYNAGPGTVEKWCKELGDPRSGGISDQQFVSAIPFDETRNYVSHAGAALQQSTPQPSYTAPDLSAQTAEVTRRAQEAGLSPEAEERALSRVRQNFSAWQQSTATARGQLDDNLKDLQSAYAHGNTTNDIPEAQIRSLYQPEDADRQIAQLSVLRTGADQANALRFAPPDQVRQAVTQDTDAMRTGEDIGAYQRRTQIAAMRNAIVSQRTKQMHDDPVTYVDSAPSMQGARLALAQAQTSGDPAQVQQAEQNYTRQSMAMQRYLAPNQTPRVLSADQAQGWVSRVLSADPSKEDPRMILSAAKQQYGSNYHQALGDMVRAGLPQPYMLMDNLSQPAAEIFSSALKAGNGKADDALKTLRASVGHDVQQKIEPPAAQGTSPLETQLSPLLSTFRAQGAPDLVDGVMQAAKLQSYAYASRGVADPVGTAAKDFLNRYDISGSVRAPKGTIGAVMPALQTLQADPSRLNVATPSSGNAALNEQDRQDREFRAIKSQGHWVTNGDESGYVLTVPSEYPGHQRIVMNKSGQPVTVALRDILSGSALQQSANPYADETMTRQAKRAQADTAQARTAFAQDAATSDWSEAQ